MSDSPVPQQLNPIAIASLVCGVLAVMCACVCYGFPFNLLALVLGIVALVQVNGDASQGGKPFAFAGIGLSVLSFLLALGLFALGMAGAIMGPILESM